MKNYRFQNLWGEQIIDFVWNLKQFGLICKHVNLENGKIFLIAMWGISQTFILTKNIGVYIQARIID